MDFSLEQLRALVAAAETGSFSAAARKLGKAQSVISAAISNLEVDLGVSLFSREGRYPKLTGAGENLLQEARHILARAEFFENLALSYHQGVETKITLALDAAIPVPWFQEILVEFSEKFPSVELEILEPAADDIIDLITSERADMGLTFQLEKIPAGVAFCDVGKLEFVAVAKSDHSLTRLDELSMLDLADHRQLLITSRSRGINGERFKVSGQIWSMESHYATLEAAKLGIGWTFVPKHIAADAVASGEISTLKMNFITQDYTLGTDLIWASGKRFGEAGGWLLNSFKNRG